MGKSLKKEQNDLKNIFIIFIISIAVTLDTIIITYPALCAIMGLGVKSAWSNHNFTINLVVGLIAGLVTEFLIGLFGRRIGGLVFSLGDGLIDRFVDGLIIGPGIGLGKTPAGYVAGIILGFLLWCVFRRLPKGFLSTIISFSGSKQELKKYSFLRSLNFHWHYTSRSW